MDGINGKNQWFGDLLRMNRSIVERKRSGRKRKYNQTGKKFLSGVPYPEPRMDWDRLRRLKLKCKQCAQWNYWYDACALGMLPDNCWRIGWQVNMEKRSL